MNKLWKIFRNDPMINLFHQRKRLNKQVLLSILLAATLVGFAYARLFSIGFVSDDFNLLAGFTDWYDPFQGFFRPLPQLSFSILFRIFGLWPAPFHLISLLLHGGNISLVYLISRRIGAGRIPAYISALLFGVNYISSEAVFWISSHTSLFMTFFYLLATLIFLRYLHEGNRNSLYFVLICYVLALLSKESALTFPFTMLICLFFLSINSGNGKPNFVKKARSLWPFLLVTVIYCLLKAPSILANVGDRTISSGYHIFRNIRLLLLSLFTLRVFPDTLFFPFDWLIIPSGRNISNLATTNIGISSLLYPILLYMALIVVVVLILRKGGKNVLAAFLIFLTCDAPFYFIQHSFQGEFGPFFKYPLRWYYLFAAFYFVFLAVVIEKIISTKEVKNILKKRAILLLAIAMVALVVCSESLQTWQRGEDWVWAGRYTVNILEQIITQVRTAPPVERIVLVNLPDSFRGAYILRNGGEAALRLYGIKAKVFVLQTNDDQPEQSLARLFSSSSESTMVLKYQEGKVIIWKLFNISSKPYSVN